MTNHGSVARIEAHGSDGSNQLSVDPVRASGAPPPIDVIALGSDGGSVPSVKPDGAGKEGGEIEGRSGASGSACAPGTRAAAANAAAGTLGAAAAGVLRAGRHVRHDQEVPRGQRRQRADDGPSMDKRRRTDIVHTRAQLLSRLGGSETHAQPGGDDARNVDQGSSRQGVLVSGSKPSATCSRGHAPPQSHGAASSVVTSRQQLLARLRTMSTSSSVVSTALRASGARSLEAVSGEFGTYAIDDRPPRGHLQVTGGPSMCTNSSSARAARADPGGAAPPALLAAPRHVVSPRYPPSDPRATRPD